MPNFSGIWDLRTQGQAVGGANWQGPPAFGFFMGGIVSSKYDIIDRVNIMHSILLNEYTEDNFENICSLQIKKFFDYKDKNLLFNEFIPSLNYKCRGIYFVPINTKYSKNLYLFKLVN